MVMTGVGGGQRQWWLLVGEYFGCENDKRVWALSGQ